MHSPYQDSIRTLTISAVVVYILFLLLAGVGVYRDVPRRFDYLLYDLNCYKKFDSVSLLIFFFFIANNLFE
jgi:hypothetical protein